MTDPDSLGELLAELDRAFTAGTFDASDLRAIWELVEWLDDPDLDPTARAKLEALVPAWRTMLQGRGIADRSYGPASRN